MVSGLLASPSNRDRVQDPVSAPLDVAVDALVKGAQDGDSASFAALYEHFYDKILRYVSFKTGNSNESEDIAEDVFLKMLESIGSFRWQGHPFSSWLFRIAHNLVVDHFRKRGRRKQVPLDDVSGLVGATSQDIDGRLDTKVTLFKVQDAMSELTALQREVISLRFAAGLSIMETAQAMGKKENAIKALQHAAIKKLRVTLGASGQDLSSQTVPAGRSR